MGFDPYGNGSHIVSDAAEGTDLRRLFCSCSVPEYHEFKLSEVAYPAPGWDKYLYPIGGCETYLSSIMPSIHRQNKNPFQK